MAACPGPLSLRHCEIAKTLDHHCRQESRDPRIRLTDIGLVPTPGTTRYEGFHRVGPPTPVFPISLRTLSPSSDFISSARSLPYLAAFPLLAKFTEVSNSNELP
ncbi:hypothetical protein HBH70_020800 [Parastagonospora nodorum]|nr:hypothetical protein HBH48_126790 [Parastagonospora nodorum]KAH5149979.1 hypothetical protein HBH70_020800 [Parastagonospora nodorum]KAH5722219.1 hypothetical protein HBI18_145190 [Parastagonospora nodorum]KAH6273342.1 hypothetical protein HBI42_017450 [Parastagonospora nodorum]